MATIKVSIARGGKVTIEAEGYTGSSCMKATEGLERALGVTKESVTKGEFYVVTEGQEATAG